MWPFVCSLEVSIPVTQSLPHYTLLTIVYVPLLIHQRKKSRSLKQGGHFEQSASHSVGSSSYGSNDRTLENPVSHNSKGTVAQLSPSTNSADDISQSSPSTTSNFRHCFNSAFSWIPTLRVAWWEYALISLADVEGNYFVVLAFQYTSITSVSLLSASTVIFVAILSRIFLGMRFRASHIGGIAGCITGLALLVYSDLLVPNDGNEARSWQHLALGDALVVIGSACYAISNVSQEYLIKKFDVIEFLACIGVFDTLITVIQALILECDDIVHAVQHRESDELWLYIAGFTACMFIIYSCVPYMLARSSATVMNLSYLMVDFWAVLANFFIFRSEFHWLRYIAFAVCLSSLVGFHILKPPSSKLDEEVRAQAQREVAKEK